MFSGDTFWTSQQYTLFLNFYWNIMETLYQDILSLEYFLRQSQET